jgi:hypothetical protein
MAERYYWLLLGALSVWRITHLLHEENGPWNAAARLRQALSPGFWADLVGCFYCLSLWVSAPVALWIGTTARERILLWLAVSAAAILLERATTRSADPSPPAIYFEHGGDHEDVLLRRK